MNQKVIEPTAFNDSNERYFQLSTSPGELVKELQNLLRLRRHLASQQEIAALVAQ
ncbi:hypothetical protein SH661x_002492 [Planctomicrobium sp. SH661]|uniref:hypothetical protein n=1 Tax=Planctomicrobium sp. SH661 TaxID=3448124 RepID=UPI003F5B257D